MKKVNLYIMALTAVCTLFTACQDEDIVQPEVTPAAIGDEIVFGGRAGFENSNPGSRTVYSDEEYTYNGVKYERIDWLNTDKIEIYSPDAANGPYAHYQITKTGTTDTSTDVKDESGNVIGQDHLNDYAYLTRIGDSSLQWGSDEDHTFYAMYPSSMMFTDDPEKTLETGVYMSGTTEGGIIVSGIVPEAQNPLSITLTDNNWEAKPNMNYAYMVAKNTANRTNGSVGLTFIPIVTAVEVQLTLPSSTDSGTGGVKTVNIAEIQVEGTGIAGSFTTQLSSWNGTSTPVCTNATGATNVIQISTWQNNKPIPITAGQTFTFTVFLLPGADVDDLKVRISDSGAGYVGKALQNVSIVAKKKNIVKNLQLPTNGIEIDASHWMAQLEPTTQMKKLSIPGTGGSFSAGYSGDNVDYFKSQTLTFEQQWAAGIRAFEIISDRPSSASTSLGSENVTCNKTSVGTTVGTVLTELINKVTETGSEECAVAILTYQPEGSNPARNAANYAGSLKVWYNSLTDAQKAVLKLYSPDLTLADAKNHVMILVRLNQKDEPESQSLETATTNYNSALSTLNGLPFLVINGCGTAKDRWGARGYTINGAVAPDISNAVSGWLSSGEYVEKYMKDAYIDPTTHSTVKRGNMNFGFATNVESTTCWYQEWTRVIPQNMRARKHSWWDWSDGGYWFESYNEKLSHVTGTFDMAISDNYSSYVFVNSLCGYLATSGYEQSRQFSTGTTYGGDGGDIKGLAEKLNPAFYQHVLTSGFEQKTGPTGIVLMDYITNTHDENIEYDGAYYLPGVIIANNFKFDTSSSKDPSGDGDGTTSGGGAI